MQQAFKKWYQIKSYKEADMQGFGAAHRWAANETRKPQRDVKFREQGIGEVLVASEMG
jgi:hypothetical protein